MVLVSPVLYALDLGLSAQTRILIPALPTKGTWTGQHLSELPALNLGHLNINTHLLAHGRGRSEIIYAKHLAQWLA